MAVTSRPTGIGYQSNIADSNLLDIVPFYEYSSILRKFWLVLVQNKVTPADSSTRRTNRENSVGKILGTVVKGKL